MPMVSSSSITKKKEFTQPFIPWEGAKTVALKVQRLSLRPGKGWLLKLLPYTGVAMSINGHIRHEKPGKISSDCLLVKLLSDAKDLCILYHLL